MHRKVWEGPDRVVENGEVWALERHAACLTYRHLVGGDGLGAKDHLEARSAAGRCDADLHGGSERSYSLVDEIAAIAETEDPDPRQVVLLLLGQLWGRCG